MQLTGNDNYGPFGEKNRTASGSETEYAPQKISVAVNALRGPRNTVAPSPPTSSDAMLLHGLAATRRTSEKE